MKHPSPGHPAHPLAEALDLGNTVLQLETIRQDRLATLPVAEIGELIDLLDAIAARIKAAQGETCKALTTRYAEQARAQLLVDGRDTGTTHIIEGEIDVTIEIGKDVKWDQAALKQLARRIAEGGEDPTEYIEVKYAVSERKYAAWPDSIRHAFTAARTVTPKSPKFVLRAVSDAAGEGK